MTIQLAPLVTPREYTVDEVRANRARWIAALRSGRYAQGRGALRVSTPLDDDTVRVEHCCLGVVETERGCQWTYVAVDAFGDELEYPWLTDGLDVTSGSDDYEVSDLDSRATTLLSDAGMAWLGVTQSDPYVVVRRPNADGDETWQTTTLSVLNDGGVSFVELADALERLPDDWDGSLNYCARLRDRWTLEERQP